MFKVLSALLFLVLVIVLIYYNLFASGGASSFYSPKGAKAQALYNETIKLIELAKPYYCNDMKTMISVSMQLFDLKKDHSSKSLDSIKSEIRELGEYIQTPKVLLDQYIVIISLAYDNFIKDGKMDKASYKAYLDEMYDGFCHGVETKAYPKGPIMSMYDDYDFDYDKNSDETLLAKYKKYHPSKTEAKVAASASDNIQPAAQVAAAKQGMRNYRKNGY
jgi:hypothetical protein